MIDRVLFHRLLKQEKNVLLLGARQVGKSTLVQALDPDLYLNFSDESLLVSYAKDPSRLKREIEAFSTPKLIVIDEIQRVPRLLNVVQLLIDAKKGHRFVLTGSSARKLRRDGANLLPGRLILEYLDPLMLEEMTEPFLLEDVLQTGSLPGIYLDPKEQLEILESYATTYLREEIMAEALTRELGAYSRFLDVAAEASGQWINYSKLANDSEIPKETIRRFFSILEDTFIAFRIPSFHPKQSSRRVSQKDRFVFFDLGVRNALLGLHKNPPSAIEKGHLFEQWMILQCLYFQRAHRKSWKISSYRSAGGAEVDCVIDTGKVLVGVECKFGRSFSQLDLRGMKSLEEVAHRPLKRYFVYTGSTRQQFPESTLLIPYQDFFLDELKKY